MSLMSQYVTQFIAEADTFVHGGGRDDLSGLVARARTNCFELFSRFRLQATSRKDADGSSFVKGDEAREFFERASSALAPLLPDPEIRPNIPEHMYLIGPMMLESWVKFDKRELFSSRALANGSSLPATSSMAQHLRRQNCECDLNLDGIQKIDDYFFALARRHSKPIGQAAEYDPSFYSHQMPGGMISNFRSQMTQLGIGNRIEEVFEEIPSVREDLGWALMVTPFSQVIATQAALNVLYGRYRVTLSEVDQLVLGYYGQTPAPISQNLLDSVVRRTGKHPIAKRPGLTLDPGVSRFRRENGPFSSDEDLLLEYLFMPEHIRALRDAGPMRLEDDVSAGPLVDLVREVAKRKNVTHLHLVM